MSVIQRVAFQRKLFSAVFYKVYQITIPTLAQHVTITEQNNQFRFCSSKSSNATLNERCYGNEPNNIEKINWLESLNFILDENFMLEDLEKTDLTIISERFGLKGLSIRYIQKYNVKITPDLTTLIFPFDSLDKEFSALQTVVYNEESIGDDISSKFSSGSSNNPALFGWSLVDPNEKLLVVTSDPLDAIAVNQSTDIAAVSLPCNFSNFCPEVLNALKLFKKVIFWMRPNLHDWECNKLLGDTLKENGYFIWSKESNNAMFCLQSGFSIQQVLREAYPLNDKRLGTVDTCKDIILEQLRNQIKIHGLKWKRFTPLNELLKGHRKGELTVFSGQTGTGKTTFMSEYSLDLCMQGLPTLWASFEISYARLMKTMLCQFAVCSPDQVLVDYESWLNKFRKIPMFILNFRNCYSLEGILSAMLSAVRLYNIQHVVIDNLQFMLNMDDYSSTIDQLRRQDQVFAAFRAFATQWECHITLVIHPRKEPEFSELNIMSISGSAKATQEADNVLILQTTKSRQYLQITKNRFDGHKGCILLEFDRNTFRFTMREINTKGKLLNEGSEAL